MSDTNGNPVRGPDGRWLPGHTAPGPGNPHLRKINAMRAALFDAVTPEDLRDVIRKLVELAKAGDLDAAGMLLDRCLGKPAASLDITADVKADLPLAEIQIVQLPDNGRGDGPPLRRLA